jgi:hypothetical protein
MLGAGSIAFGFGFYDAFSAEGNECGWDGSRRSRIRSKRDRQPPNERIRQIGAETRTQKSKTDKILANLTPSTNSSSVGSLSPNLAFSRITAYLSRTALAPGSSIGWWKRGSERIRWGEYGWARVIRDGEEEKEEEGWEGRGGRREDVVGRVVWRR